MSLDHTIDRIKNVCPVLSNRRFPSTDSMLEIANSSSVTIYVYKETSFL